MKSVRLLPDGPTEVGPWSVTGRIGGLPPESNGARRPPGGAYAGVRARPGGFTPQCTLRARHPRPPVEDTIMATEQTTGPIALSPGMRVDHVFPTLTTAQMARVASHGRVRAVATGEILVDVGRQDVPFFVVT